MPIFWQWYGIVLLAHLNVLCKLFTCDKCIYIHIRLRPKHSRVNLFHFNYKYKACDDRFNIYNTYANILMHYKCLLFITKFDNSFRTYVDKLIFILQILESVDWILSCNCIFHPNVTLYNSKHKAFTKQCNFTIKLVWFPYHDIKQFSNIKHSFIDLEHSIIYYHIYSANN